MFENEPDARADSALIVAHGQPSAPEGAQADLEAFAASVAEHLPGWRIRGATLAAPGALARAVGQIGPAPVVWPLFMADGWFTGTLLPRRLAEAGAADARLTRPFGRDPALPGLMVEAARAGLAGEGWDETETAVLVAAHGAPSNRRPRRAAEAAALAMAAQGRFRYVTTGFVDEAPGIAAAAATLTQPALCLPFFARLNGHMREDVPAALSEAAFAGPLLAPIGMDAAVPALAARAIAARVRCRAA